MISPQNRHEVGNSLFSRQNVHNLHIVQRHKEDGHPRRELTRPASSTSFSVDSVDNTFNIRQPLVSKL